MRIGGLLGDRIIVLFFFESQFMDQLCHMIYIDLRIFTMRKRRFFLEKTGRPPISVTKKPAPPRSELRPSEPYATGHMAAA